MKKTSSKKSLLMHKSNWSSCADNEESFSFIVRVRMNELSDQSRLHFRLEDVSACREWSFTDYASTTECLALRVNDVIKKQISR